MRTGYIYMAVIMLQFFVFFNNVSLIFHPSNIRVFYFSMGAYALSIVILVIGIVRGAKAGGGNCFMTLLFLINMFFYIWYSFAGFLNSFMTGVK
jgi:hypothetical protein